MVRLRRLGTAGVAVGCLCLATACGSSSSGSSSGGSTAASSSKTIIIGDVNSESGPLEIYAKMFDQGLAAGLKYATNGTMQVDGYTLQVVTKDDTGVPSVGAAAVTALIGSGVKIIVGATDSATALAEAQLATTNHVIFIPGGAASDELTGYSKYVFRSGHTSYDDAATFAQTVPSWQGKTVVVAAQDEAIGTDGLAAVKAAITPLGGKVTGLLMPTTTTNFTPYARQLAVQKPDVVYVQWAGTGLTPLVEALDQQGVFKTSTVTGTLEQQSSYSSYGPQATKILWSASYYPAVNTTPANLYMIKAIQAMGGQADILSPNGFSAAQMIVHAIQVAKGDNVDEMISALNGYTFQGPWGAETVRAADHYLIRDGYLAKITIDNGNYVASNVKVISGSAIAPPPISFSH
jgi:branched-chain amino acid transport system substrate-binding protein